MTPVLRENKDTASDPSEADQSLKIVWVSSPKDPKIDPNNVWQQDKYDYPFQQERWTQLLSLADNTQITNVSKWPGREQFNDADVIVFYCDYPEFNDENGKQLDAFLERGGGLVYLSQAIKTTADPQALANRIGLAWKGGSSKTRDARLQLDFGNKKHPITEGFDQAVFQDEIYWELIEGKKDINVLATVNEAGSPRPIIWTTTQGKGRVFATTLGHWTWTFDDPLFRILLLRGIAWAGNQTARRMEDIAMMGARVSK